MSVEVEQLLHDNPELISVRKVLAALDRHDLAVLEWRMRWLRQARPKQLPPQGDWNVWGVMSGRGFGKCLDLDTPIPTITGWATMRHIKEGQVLFDEQGQPTTVVKVHPVKIGLPCYRVMFSDHSEVVCDSEHLWQTDTKLSRKRGRSPQVRTTTEIMESIEYGSRKEANHSIPCTRALDLPDRTLPIDPYLLGYWLGNGSSDFAQVYCHREDSEEIQNILSQITTIDRVSLNSENCIEIGLGQRQVGRMAANGRFVSQGSFYADLKTNNLIRNKHIPTEYLRGSSTQRLSLLQGLMDSDGHAHISNGTCEFSTVREDLAKAAMELIRTLGLKPSLCTTTARCGDKVYGNCYRVTFTAYFPVFRLTRKATRQRPKKSQAARQTTRYIKQIVPVPSVPVRCIEVDSPSHLFLCGEAMIPTHNTLTGSNWIGLEAAQNTNTYNGLVGATGDDVRGVMIEGPTGLLNIIPSILIDDYNVTLHKITLWNGSTIRGFSAEEPRRMRGPQHHKVYTDECGAWTLGAEAWDMMKMGLRLGQHPQVLWTSTPKQTELIRRLLADPKARIINGSTYENRDNLAKNFFDEIAQYEGTKLGRQEIHGELIDIEEGGVIKRSDWRLWPATRPLPKFRFIIMSLDTAFTEKTIDRRSRDPDPTACQIWGVFDIDREMQFVPGVPAIGSTCVMLLDAWKDHLGFPQLVARVKKERRFTYGDAEEPLVKTYLGTNGAGHQGRPCDLILIEDKGSGISLRQQLALEDIYASPYNPGRMDKLARLHAVSPLWAHGRVWAVESDRHPGKPRAWAESAIMTICTYQGKGSVRHDDEVDACTQALIYVKNSFMGAMTVNDRVIENGSQHERITVNPYAI